MTFSKIRRMKDYEQIHNYVKEIEALEAQKRSYFRDYKCCSTSAFFLNKNSLLLYFLMYGLHETKRNATTKIVGATFKLMMVHYNEQNFYHKIVFYYCMNKMTE